VLQSTIATLLLHFLLQIIGQAGWFILFAHAFDVKLQAHVSSHRTGFSRAAALSNERKRRDVLENEMSITFSF